MTVLYKIHGQPGFEPDHVIFTRDDGAVRYYIFEGEDVRLGIMADTLVELLARIPAHERGIFARMIAEGRTDDVYFRHPFVESL